MLINLEENEVKSLLFAISTADYEGYGPEGFDKGDWTSLINKLENV